MRERDQHFSSGNYPEDPTGVRCSQFVCFVIVAIPLAATLFTALKHWQRNKGGALSPESSKINYGKNTRNHVRLCFSRHCLERLLQMLCLQNTSKGVLSTASSIPGGAYSSLYGIRVLSLLWIICGHLAKLTIQNSLETLKSNRLYVISYSGPVFLAVDTFLLMGGLLSARTLLNFIKRADGEMNATLVARYLLNRIKRTQPLNIFIMCLAIGLSSLFSLQPHQFLGTGCKKYWWANVLLVNNLIGNHICIPWTWYISLDFQFYATTPLLLFFYKLNLRVFTVVSGALLLLTTTVGAVLPALLQMPVFSPLPIEKKEVYYMYYYSSPFTRYGPFLIGIITGIYMTTKTDRLIKQRWQAAVGWFCSLSLMALLVEMAYILKDTPSYPSIPHALYQGLHRTLWTCAVSWIIVACEEGYGGFIKSFLCCGIWIPLSNISLACYLIHPLLILLYNGAQVTPFIYTDLNFMYLFFGCVVSTVLISYLLTVLIERPYFFKLT
uniref:O-acyltransferase like n=1 Tax=Cynoglossus semilaevis TaxID=244447 RepID=A0A3P8X1G2_CYNSE